MDKIPYTRRTAGTILSVFGAITSIAGFIYMVIADVELAGVARFSVPSLLTIIFVACISYLVYIAFYMRHRAALHDHRASLYKQFLSDMDGISLVRLHLLRHILGGVGSGSSTLDTSSSELENVLNHARDLFSRQTGDECGVCIKMIEETAGSETVRTLARDSASGNRRHRTDVDYPSYRIWENTAFDQLVKKNMPRFLSNDLAREPDYYNCNVRWREYYNACLVVPIASSMDEEVVGFLCIDNRGGNLQDDISVPLATHLAKGLFELFYIDATLQSSGPRMTKAGESDV